MGIKEEWYSDRGVSMDKPAILQGAGICICRCIKMPSEGELLIPWTMIRPKKKKGLICRPQQKKGSILRP